MDPGSTNCLQQEVTNKLQTEKSHNSETQELSEMDLGRSNSLKINESQLKKPDSDELNMSNLSLDDMEVKLEDNPPDMFEKIADDLETTQMKDKYDRMIGFYHDELFVSSNQYSFFNQECEIKKKFNYVPMVKEMFFDAIRNPNNVKDGERQNIHKRNILQKKTKYSVSELNSPIYKQQQEKSRLELNETVDSKQFETEFNCKTSMQDANTNESQRDSQVEMCRLEPEILNSPQIYLSGSLSCTQLEINEDKLHTLNHPPTIKSEVSPDKITCTQEQTHCTSPPQLGRKLNLGERKASKLSEPTPLSELKSIFNSDKRHKSEPSSRPQLGSMLNQDKRKEVEISETSSPPKFVRKLTPDKRKETQLSEPTSSPLLESKLNLDKRKEVNVSQRTTPSKIRGMLNSNKRNKSDPSEPTSPPKIGSMLNLDKIKEAKLSEPTIPSKLSSDKINKSESSEPTSPPILGSKLDYDRRKAQLSEPISPPKLRSKLNTDISNEGKLSEPMSPPKLRSKLTPDKRKEANLSEPTTPSKLSSDKINKSESSEPTSPPILGSKLDYDRRKAQLSEPISPPKLRSKLNTDISNEGKLSEPMSPPKLRSKLTPDKRKEANLSEPTTPSQLSTMFNFDKRHKSEPSEPTSPPNLGSMFNLDKRKKSQLSEQSSPPKLGSKVTPSERKEAKLYEPTTPSKIRSMLNSDTRNKSESSEPTTPLILRSKLDYDRRIAQLYELISPPKLTYKFNTDISNEGKLSEAISPPKLRSKLTPDKRKEAQLSEPTSPPKLGSKLNLDGRKEAKLSEPTTPSKRTSDKRNKNESSEPTTPPILGSKLDYDRRNAQLSEPISPPKLRSKLNTDICNEGKLSEPISPPKLRSKFTSDKRKEAQLSEPTSPPKLGSKLNLDGRKEAKLSEPTTPSKRTSDKINKSESSEPTTPPILGSKLDYDRRNAQLSEPSSPPKLRSKLNTDICNEGKLSEPISPPKLRSKFTSDKRKEAQLSEPTSPPKLRSKSNLYGKKEAKLSEPTTPSKLISDKINKSQSSEPTSPQKLKSMLNYNIRKEAQLSEPTSPPKLGSKLNVDKRKEAKWSEPTTPSKVRNMLNVDKRNKSEPSEPTCPPKLGSILDYDRRKAQLSEPSSPPRLKSKLTPDKTKEAKLSESTSPPKLESNCTKQEIHESRPDEIVCPELKIDNMKIRTKKSLQPAITEFVPGSQIHRENNETKSERKKSVISITQTDRQHCTEHIKISEIEPTKTKYAQCEQAVGLQHEKTNDAQQEETIETESKRKKSATNNVQIHIRIQYTEQLNTSKIESTSPNYSEQDLSTGKSHPDKNVVKRETTSSLQLKISNTAQQDATSTSQPDRTNYAQASKMNDSRTNRQSHPQQTIKNKHKPNDSQHKVIKVKLATTLYKNLCEDMANEKDKETSIANGKTSVYDHEQNVGKKIERSEQNKKFEDFSSVKKTLMLALGLDFQDKNESVYSLSDQGQEIFYACDYCENVFDDKGSLIFHLASHKFIRNTRNPVLKPLVKKFLGRSQNTSCDSNVGDYDNHNANVKLLNDYKASETINESEQVKEDNNVKILNNMHSSIHENVHHKHHKQSEITSLGNCPIEDSSSKRAKDVLKNVSDFNSKDLCRHNDKKKQESRTEEIFESTSSNVRKRKTSQFKKDKTINFTTENNVSQNHRELAASSYMNVTIFKGHQDACAQQEETREFELDTNYQEQIQTTALTNHEANHIEKNNCAQPEPLSQLQLEVTNLEQTTQLQHENSSDAQQGKTSEFEPEINNFVHQEQARKLEHKITNYVQQKPTVELQEEINKSVKQDPTSEMLTETTKCVKRRKIKQSQSKLTDYSQATSKLQQKKATYREALNKKVLKLFYIFNRPMKKSEYKLGKGNCTQPKMPISAGTHSQKLKKLQLETKKSIQPVVNEFEEETKIDLETIEMESKRKNNMLKDIRKYTEQLKTSKIKPTSPNHSQQDPSTGKSDPEKNIGKREKTSSLQLKTSNPAQKDATSTSQPETTKYAQASRMNGSRTNRLSHPQQTITNKHELNDSQHSKVIKVKLAPRLYKKLCEDLENEKDKETSTANVTTGNRSKYDTEQNVEKQIEGSEQKKDIEDFASVKETFILALGLDFQDKNESIKSLNHQGQEISYACGYCENVFDDKGPLIFHLASHKFIRNTRNPVLKPLVKEILERSQSTSTSSAGDDKNHSANVKLLNDSKASETINGSEQGKENNNIKLLNGVYSSIRENVDHRQHKESEITALKNCPRENSSRMRVKNTFRQKEQESRTEEIVKATSSNGRKRKKSQSKNDITINITTENNVLENYREHAAGPGINDDNSKMFQDKGSPNSVSVGDEINTSITSSKLRLPKKNKRKRERNVNTEDTSNRFFKEKLPRTEEILEEKGTGMVGINSTQSAKGKNSKKSVTDKIKYLKNLKIESKKQNNKTNKNSTEISSAIEASFSALHLDDTSKEKNSQFRQILTQNFSSTSLEISNDKNHIANDTKASENNQLENYTEPTVNSSINNDNSKILDVSYNRVLGKEIKSVINSSKLSLPNKNKRKRQSKGNLINVPQLNTEDLCKPNYEEKQPPTAKVIEEKGTNVVRINRTESRRIITARRSVTAKIKQSNNCTIGVVNNNAIEGNSGDNSRIIEDKGSPDGILETGQINSTIGPRKRKLSKTKKKKLDNTALLDVCPKSITDIRKLNINEAQPQTGEESATNEVGISKKQPKRNITKTRSVSTEKDCTESNVAPQNVNTGVGTEEDTFICNNCGRILKSKYMLISHLKTHSVKSSLTAKNTRDMKFKCKTCRSKFATQSELLNHEVKAHDCDKSYRACTICEYKTPYPYRLTAHMRAHNNIKPFECNFCKKEFRTRNDLKLHVRTHTGETPYQCEFCLLKFSRRPTLNRHLKTHSGERPYKCVYCAADFKLVSALKHHLNTHADERPFKCSNCTSSFRDTSALEEHMRSHKGETPYKCYCCQYSSASRHGLQRHAKTHEIEASDVAKKKSLLAERPHKCTVCTASFTLLSHLKRHLNIHFKEKCYKCTTCSSSFSDGSSLKRHMRCHTGEKSYKCNQCEYTTANNFDLTRHAKLHLKTNNKK